MISAEEKGFEPLVQLPVRRFSNSNPLPLQGFGGQIPAENRAAETKKSGLSAPEDPRDQALDQGQDHETKGLVLVSVDLLEAVAAGSTTAVDLAHALARTVLDTPVVHRARELDQLLKARSPFALVRAVELAELLARDSTPSVKRRTTT
jgi:hypothetical protein